MNTILIAIISLSSIGFLCAAVITIASKVMFVKVDVRVEKINNCLPGANCGACGFSSCEGYAEALVMGESASNLCLPGGETAYEQINEILELNETDGLAKKVAVVRCLGDTTIVKDKMDYFGENSCFAAKRLFGGQSSCTFGCMGFGDCFSVCPSEAICIENGLARIDPRRCSGCGVCLNVCPSGVITVEALPLHVAVMCSNTEKGARVRAKCSRGCIGCSKCVAVCPAKTITVKDSLARIDYSICYGCKECKAVCITKCIV